MKINFMIGQLCTIFCLVLSILNTSDSYSAILNFRNCKTVLKDTFFVLLAHDYSEFLYNYFKQLSQDDEQIAEKNVSEKVTINTEVQDSMGLYDRQNEHYTHKFCYSLILREEKLGYVVGAFTKNKVGYVTGLHVEPHVRNQGYGTLLLEKILIDLEKKESCKFVRLYSTNENATRLYRRFGFRGNNGPAGIMVKFFEKDKNKEKVIIPFLTA